MQVDNNVTRHLDSTLKRDDWDILILHYLGLDHIGHISGPYSSLIQPKLLEMDDILKKIHSGLISKVISYLNVWMVVVIVFVFAVGSLLCKSVNEVYGNFLKTMSLWVNKRDECKNFWNFLTSLTFFFLLLFYSPTLSYFDIVSLLLLLCFNWQAALCFPDCFPVLVVQNKSKRRRNIGLTLMRLKWMPMLRLLKAEKGSCLLWAPLMNWLFYCQLVSQKNRNSLPSVYSCSNGEHI